MTTTEELTMHLWAIKASIKALKSTLNSEQMESYNASIEAEKRKFIEHHPSFEKEFEKQIDSILP